jgi:hypothetical protein
MRPAADCHRRREIGESFFKMLSEMILVSHIRGAGEA